MQLLRADVDDAAGDGLFDDCQGAWEVGGSQSFVGFEEGSEKSSLEFGVEDGGSDAFSSELIGVGSWQALDEPVESEASEVTGPPLLL